MKRRDFIKAAVGAAARGPRWPARKPFRPVHHADRAVRGRRADRRAGADPGRAYAGDAGADGGDRNVTGASGAIAGLRAARATPDGTTLTIGHWGTHVLNGAVTTLQYDVLNDFEPVALVGNGPQLIIGKPKLPARI